MPFPPSSLADSLLNLTALLLLLAGAAAANSQAAALLEIRDGFANGPEVLSSWGNDSSASPCSWEGVTCNAANVVTQLWLKGLGLAGTIPLAGWDQLQGLQFLDVSSNSLSGSIPPSWRLPDSLQGLGLTSNRLEGTVSASWQLPASLAQLYLASNSLSGPLPALAFPAGLAALSLASNQLAGPISAAWVGSLPAGLQQLLLQFNSLSGVLPADWSATSSLVELSLSGNRLGGPLPPGLRLPGSLTKLYLGGNAFNASIPPDWLLPQGLLELGLQNNFLTGALPTSLPQNLTAINLGNNRLRGTIPPDWELPPSLSILRLYSNSLSGPLPPQLPWPQSLAEINMSSNALTGSLPPSLPPKLRVLDLGGNRLQGEISPNWSLPHYLATIMLYNNSISGFLPSQLQLPHDLLYLNLNLNKLSGPLPNWALPEGMLTFAVANNSFSGAIPYQQLPASLMYLDFSFNSLTGTLPGASWNLPNLTLASFYFNRLTGTLPSWQGNASAIVQVQPQNGPAGFCGQLPTKPQYVKFNVANLSWIPLTAADVTPTCPQPPSGGGGSHTAVIVAGVLAGVAVIAVAALVVIFLRRRKHLRAAAADIESNGSKLAANSNTSKISLQKDKLLELALKSARSGSFSLAQSSSMMLDLKIFLIDFQTLDLVKQIGEGSFGRVYLARWQHTPVACKVLLSTNSSDESGEDTLQKALTLSNPVLENLQKEAGLMAAMRHPNIVGFLGVCTAPPCVVTEFCSRGSLTDVLRQARQSPAQAAKLDWPRRLGMVHAIMPTTSMPSCACQCYQQRQSAASLAAHDQPLLPGVHWVHRCPPALPFAAGKEALDTAKGMLYLHSHSPPIIHRDLKSPNLLVDTHWRVKVSDFNLSKILEDTVVLSTLQATNPRWLAPEVLEGQPGTLASDVFAFGIVLWEMLTWEVPFAQENHWQLVKHLANGGRPPIPERNALPGPGSSAFEGLDDYIALIRRCWAQAPEERPAFNEIVSVVKNLLTRALRAVGAPTSPLVGRNMSPASSGVPAYLQQGGSGSGQAMGARMVRGDSEETPTMASGGSGGALSGGTPPVLSGALPTATDSQPTTDSSPAPSPLTPNDNT